jgi:hydrogenase maturation protein HypF
MRIVVRGAVQGVGFRPFVYRLAVGLGLRGWVNNTAHGVFVEVEGPSDRLREFLLRLPREKPAVSTIHNLQHTVLDPAGYRDFAIVASEAAGEAGDITAALTPDIATCRDCLREMFDPENRRYRYPFVNCTHCGPRFTIVETLPYDRSNTTMKAFEVCPACAAEYEDPADRRFHAQPNACPRCGPRLEWWDSDGEPRACGDDALAAAADAVRRGRIVAVKGLGGFHLIVDARSGEAVTRLRERKHRDEKPFAVMVPSAGFARVHCTLETIEANLLRSPEAPIVLVRRGRPCPIDDAVAPRNPYLGVMLPYSPVHHLLMSEIGFPVVATSGNLAEESICIDEYEAVERLGEIADAFLVHNRPIARPVDDSVVRVVVGRVLVLRRGRGYAPLPVLLPAERGGDELPPMLAVGGHLKNTVAIARGGQIFMSQHVGDLSTQTALDAFAKVVSDFRDLYRFEPARIVCDAHPDYVSTRYADRLAAVGKAEAFDASAAGNRAAGGAATCGATSAPSHAPVVKVQHHHAHVAACMVENGLEGPLLGVSWDGTGYGLDGTVWGGEFFRVEAGSFQRVAHLRTFRLPGGDAAVKEPRRSAVGLLYEVFGRAGLGRTRLAPIRSLTERELSVIAGMLIRQVNAPLSSSAGRLFDAVASLCGIRQRNSYEGQSAMALEFAGHGIDVADLYSFHLRRGIGHPLVVDWEHMIRGVLRDVENGVGVGVVSAKFHNTLAEAIAAVARAVGEERVVLSGGCFQNKYLTEKTVARLMATGFKPYWHQLVPPNDGGLALGQLAAAAAAHPRGEQKRCV